ncbi:MAG: hypothetical protein QOE97_1447 [Pseudonocardiales bacterium]|jgi:hypothetical protein|nr:hypothetical protein [Pseudonocardiales bacterium]
MTVSDQLSGASERVRSWAERQADQYRAGSDRPLDGYLTLMTVYGAGVGVAAVAGRLFGRRVPDRVGPLDLVTLSVATHRLARTMAKDPVTSPLRAPFTAFAGTSAPAELAETVRHHGGVKHSLGELVTCPMCLAQWVATGLGAGLVFAPRQTRLVNATLTAVAGADFLQHVYAWLQRAAE